MSLKAIKGKIESQELNDNFSYLDSNKRDRNQEIQMSDLSQEVKEGMTGGSVAVVGPDSVGNINIKNEAVSVDKVDFIKHVTEGELSNTASYVKGNLGSSNLSYVPINPSYPDAETIVVPIKPGRTYTINVTNTSDWTRTRAFLFDNYPTSMQVADRVVINDDNYKETIKFTNDSAEYLFLYLNQQGNRPSFEIIEETNYLDKDKVRIDENVIEPVNTTFFRYSKKNLFNKSVALSGYIHGQVGESFAYFRDWQAVWPDAKTHIIKIDPNETYTIQTFGGNRRRFALASEFPEASIGNVENPEIKLIYNDGVDDVFTFTSENDTQYLMVYLSTTGEDVRCQVEEGVIPTEYEPAAWIDDKYLRNVAHVDGGTSGKSEHFIVGNFNEVYTSPEMPDMSSGVLSGTTITDVYDWYDEIMSDNTDVMSKKLLGYGHNADGNIDNSLPIYEYEIKASETTNVSQGGTNAELDKAPLMLFVSGVHGNEKAAVYGLYQTIKQMFENPNNSEAMESLLANFTFKIIPIVNPDGYNRNRRLNGRDVNINRNFSYQWEEFPVGEKGDEPYSENESKILRDWLVENREAFAYLDFHNFNRNYSGRDRAMNSYNLTPNRDLDKMYGQMIRVLSKRWKKTYMKDHADANGDIAYGFLLSNFYRQTPATINEAYHVAGILLSATPESALQDPISTSTHYTSASLELTVEVFTNYIFSMINRFG